MFFVLPKRENPIICRSKAISGSESISISFFEMDSAGAVAGVGVAFRGRREFGVVVPLRAGDEAFRVLDAAEESAVEVFGWELVALEAEGA